MNQGSHGIGLNMCKRFAVLLGGDLYLNEDYHQGCEFILKLILKRKSYTTYVIDEEIDDIPLKQKLIVDENNLSSKQISINT